ncbi:pfs domain-containing [Trichoderma arundinaceum]|uniref:Pfs domain-containing n=1 Tax=Trichoderma arundinaceum TaxID=490622 RepID=A0A395NED3_TRIAR|nr:pfs domain-containing [Trichoderma arundinaceum]
MQPTPSDRPAGHNGALPHQEIVLISKSLSYRALPLEANNVSALFDRRWDVQRYGKATGDSNAYSLGLVGHHNIVLVHMPNMGKVAAATAAAGLCASFQRINIALVVGICGGAPFGKHRGEILLGDVVVSEGLIQYDLGRWFPNNKFARKDTPRDNLPRPNPEIQAALAKLQAEHDWLQDKVSEYLGILRPRFGEAVEYPGATEDILFKSTYQHKHHQTSVCTTCSTGNGKDNICDTALGLNCEQLGCDKQELVSRISSVGWEPTVHFGLIASGDTVMKSGEDRDAIAVRDGVIAFEMEGAGAWENLRGSLVIKGICDYAEMAELCSCDCHRCYKGVLGLLE